MEISEHNKVLNKRCCHHLPIFVNGHQLFAFRNIVDDEASTVSRSQNFAAPLAFNMPFKISLQRRIDCTLICRRERHPYREQQSDATTDQ